jgi:signal transduction histidine kinase/CheY-like chemotaxis protein
MSFPSSSSGHSNNQIESNLAAENLALREEIEEARETIRALRSGEVDALVVTGPNGIEILTLQGSEKLAASVFEQATEAILVCDSSGRIIRASKAAHDLCGRNPLLQQFDSVYPLFTQVPGSPRTNVHPTDFAKLLDAAKQKPLRGMEVLYECQSGETRYLLLSASPWIGLSDEFLGCVIILTDITVLKDAQRSLAKAADEARHQSKAREDFIAILAHELRNPLAPIRNSIAAMRMIEKQDPRLRQSFDIVDRQVSHVVRMIDDLLDISRLERGKLNMDKQPVSLHPLINRAVETCTPQPNQDRREITISLPADELILNADPMRLEQVISNVLGNAIKFTRDGGHIWIAAERVENYAVLRIKDDGLGISNDMLPKIFSMFSQEEHSKSKGGLGIGLALVTQILKLHGGEIRATSAGPGRGSEFIISLPLSQTPLDPQAKPMLPTISQPAKNVLIVEDNADSRESLSVLLSLWGHEVEVAENGQRGLDLALAKTPDIAFIDVNLPDMNGYQVANQIRERLKDKVTLVALTGYGQPEDFSRTKDAGFDKHLVKPADMDALRQVFES